MANKQWCEVIVLTVWCCLPIVPLTTLHVHKNKICSGVCVAVQKKILSSKHTRSVYGGRICANFFVPQTIPLRPAPRPAVFWGLVWVMTLVDVLPGRR